MCDEKTALRTALATLSAQRVSAVARELGVGVQFLYNAQNASHGNERARVGPARLRAIAAVLLRFARELIAAAEDLQACAETAAPLKPTRPGPRQ